MSDQKSQDVGYFEEQYVSRIDPNLVDQWGDPNKHPETQLSKEETDQLIQAAREMFISHLTKDGWPITTVQIYCIIDGEIWSTTVRGRVKAAAFRRDPRTSICISSAGLGLPWEGGVCIKAKAEIIEDREIIDGVCHAHGTRYFTTPKAQELWLRTLLTPNRVAIRFHIDKIISWKNMGQKADS